MNRLGGRRSLRVRISLLILVLVSLGLLASSMIATAALRGYLSDRIDEQLSGASEPFARFAEPIPPAIGQGDQPPRPPSRFYVEIIRNDGRAPEVIETPDGMAGSTPDLPAATSATSLAGQPFTVGSREGGDPWRVLVTPMANGEGWIVLAMSLAELQGTVTQLVLLQLIVGMAVVIVAVSAGYLIVRRSLTPLDEMSAVASDIAAGDLSLRVSEEGSSSEVDRLASSFNSMVTRIEEAFAAEQASERQARQSEQRMRQFVADASHELRTPLTTIRGYAELVEEGAAQDPAAAVRKIEAEATRMGRLVDDLLLLARLDEQPPIAADRVNLLDVVLAAVAGARVADPGRSIAVHVTEDGPPPMVLGEERRLRQVVDNLLSNAVRYSPVDGPVDVTLTTTTTAAGAGPGSVRLAVTDEGPGLSPEQAERVFERLYRTDEARSRVRGGTGLGLAIVRSIIDAHHGEVSVTSTVGSGSTFTVVLPLAD